MPRIGNVDVSDDVVASLGRATGAGTPGERPGLLGILKSASQQAYAQVRFGAPLAVETATGTVNDRSRGFYEQGLERGRVAGAVNQAASLDDWRAGRVGITRFIAENLASSAPQTIATLGAGVAGGLAGGPGGALAAATAVGTPFFAGSNTDRAVQENGHLDEGAAGRALLTAPVQAASDALVERFLPGADKVLGGWAAHQTGGFLARTAKSIAKAGATEAVTEAGQQLGERYAAGLDVSGPDAAAEYVNAAVTAFGVGGVLGAGGGFRRGPAHAKPAADVTTEDLLANIDSVLDGTQRALPGPAPTLALPAPGQGVPVAPGNDISRAAMPPADFQVDPRGNAAPATPQGTADLAATPIGDVVTSALGDSLVRPTAADLSEFNNRPYTEADQRRDALAAIAARGPAPAAPGLDMTAPAVRDLLANMGKQGLPFTPPASVDPRTSDTSALAQRFAAMGERLQSQGFQIDPDAAPAAPSEVTPRMFTAEPVDVLEAVAKAKGASAEVKAEAAREIAARRDEATGAAELTTDNFQQRVDELKSGLRGSFVTKLTATSPADLVDKVYTRVFEDQDTSSSTVKLAQRAGLLDEKLEPTARANEIEAARTAAQRADVAPEPTTTAVTTTPAAAEPVEDKRPAVGPRQREAVSVTAPAAVDPAYQQQWSRTKAEAGISRDTGALKEIGTPANQADAEAKVMRALANDSVVSTKGASPVEKLAQKMGLISADEAMEVTPLGRKAFLNTSEGLEETVNAATQQGYSGAQASIFDRGVRELLSGQAESTHTSFEDMAAYQAGRVWAQRFMDTPTTKPLTATAKARLDKRGMAGETSSPRLSAAEIEERTQAEPGEVQRRALNNLLDNADFSNVADTDVAGLRKMVRDGAAPEAVGRALQDVQGGKVLFAPRAPTPAPTRGQPVFKEMNPERQARRAPTRGEARATRAATEPAVRAYNVRNDIDFAKETGLFGDKRAQMLHDLVDKGDVQGAERLLAIITKAKDLQGRAAEDTSDLDRIAASSVREEAVVYGQPKQFEKLPEDGARMVRPAPGALLNDRQMAEYRKRYWAEKQRQDAAASAFRGSILGTADQQFEQAVTGKSFDQVLEHLATNGSSAYHRAIAGRIQALAKQIEKAGKHTFAIKIVRPGDMAPRALNSPSTRAYTVTTKVPSMSTVWLKSSEMGGESGMNQQLALHEMLHAVTMQAISAGRLTSNKDTKLGKAVTGLVDLRNQIIAHFNARADAGNLNDFEQAYFQRYNNSLSDSDEVLAWGLTNPDMQAYLNGIEFAPKQSVFSKLVDLVRNLLGLDVKQNSALAELMRVSENILGLDARDLQPMFARDRTSGLEEEPLAAPAAALSESNRTVQASTEAMTKLAGLTEQVVSHINPADLGVKARRVALGWLSRNQIDRQYGARMPGLVSLSDGLRQKDAVRGRFASIGDQVNQNFEKLERDSPENFKRLKDLMATSTRFRLDPDKAFDDHTHLEGDPNLPALKRLHGEVVKLKNDLSRGDGAGYRVFNEARASNELMNYARLAAELHSLVALDPEFSLGIAGSDINPMDVFMTQSGLAGSAEIRDYWQKALQQQIAAATAFVTQKKGEAAAGTISDQRATQQHISPIEAKIASTYEAIAGMQRAPYFHLGRFGDNFGSAVIAKLENGAVDPKAQARVAEELEKAGFGDADMSLDNTRPRFSLRFETVDQTRAFEALAKRLQAEGLIEADTIKSGPRARADNYGVADTTPGFVQRYIQAIEQSPTFQSESGMSPAEIAELNKRRDEAVQLARDTWIASQPDSAISKVLTARHSVSGFTTDMVRSYAHRWSVGATSLASVATSARISKAYMDMRAQANEATEAETADDPQLLADLLTESKKRDAVNPADNSDGKFFDKLRAYGHAYFLGFSPAYGAIQLMQVGTNGVPELAKSHGYGKSFHAIRRATPKAFAILRAANAIAREQGWEHAADLTLTENVLAKAGLSQKETAFLRQMIATGSIDIGSSAHALGEVAKGNSANWRATGLKYASAIGLYTEAASRLMTALAAHDLHGGEVGDSAKYAQGVVSNSMFDYQNWNRARQLGKQGFAGPVTPLLTQFMTYSAQMTEKLFSEVHGAIGKTRVGETDESAAQRRAASRTFLLGHLTAITALAGTLGLPFASVFATAIERLVDALDGDDEPYDATASWRNFLAGVLGKDAAEVISRGLPRAVGFDISNRVGESDLLPFSQMLGDRRSWKESISSALGRSAGASPDMLMSLADGGAQMARGDVLGGMKEMLPVAFKGPTEAYRMSTEGYVDTRGNKLPMSPRASSIMWQLLGFAPSEKAEYGEARNDQSGRRVAITQQGNRLRQRIVRALLTGDQEKATSLISDAQDFDRANPAFAVIPSLAGAMRRQQESAARARALGTPLGVNMDDLAGRALTGYANVNYR